MENQAQIRGTLNDVQGFADRSSRMVHALDGRAPNTFSTAGDSRPDRFRRSGPDFFVVLRKDAAAGPVALRSPGRRHDYGLTRDLNLTPGLWLPPCTYRRKVTAAFPANPVTVTEAFLTVN